MMYGANLQCPVVMMPGARPMNMAGLNVSTNAAPMQPLVPLQPTVVTPTAAMGVNPVLNGMPGCFMWMPMQSPSQSSGTHSGTCSAVTTPEEEITTVFPDMLTAPQANQMVHRASIGSTVTTQTVDDSNDDISDFSDLPPLGEPDMRRSSKMRASVSTPLPGLAGAFAKRLRRGVNVELEAMGPAAVAQVMRGLILARSFLDRDGISFTVDCGFVSDLDEVAEGSHPSLCFPLVRQDAKLDVSAGRTLSVSSSAVVGKTAGAIAKELRASTSSVACNICAGPSATALNIAAKSLALAKIMLKDDGLSLKIQPVIPKNARPKPEVQTLTFAAIVYKLDGSSK